MGNKQGKRRNFTKLAVMKTKEPTIDSAYILGVFLTDGCIYKDRFILKSIDRDYCEHTMAALRNTIDGNIKENIIEKPEFKNKQNGYISKKTYEIAVGSTDLCQWLIETTGYKQRIPDIFLNANKEIQLSLLAGLLDGDGSIALTEVKKEVSSRYKIMLVGHEGLYKCVKDYEKLLAKLGIVYRKHAKKSDPEFFQYVINNTSFVQNGGYFKIERKLKRLEHLRDLIKNMSKAQKTAVSNLIKRRSFNEQNDGPILVNG